LAEYEYTFFDWQVLAKTTLVDLRTIENRFEIEVFAFDREPSDVLELLPDARNITPKAFIPAWPLEPGLDYLHEFVGLIDDRRMREYEQAESIGHEQFYRALLSVRIPRLGSPPAAWDTLASFLTTAGPFGTAILIAHETGQPKSWPTLIFFGLGMTVVINIVQPTTRALGDALSNEIRKRAGLDREGEGDEESTDKTS
jgi:hypothetical protein